VSNPVVGELIDLLQLERLEENLFRGQSRDIGTKYVFGGQVLGQALSAAQQTVDPARAAHSLHAYFLRAGDIEAPIVYNVERTRDGGSFSVRRVVAIQHGEPIFNCSVSFQIEQSGIEHAASMPVVPRPDELPPRAPLPPELIAKLPVKLQRWFGRNAPFEMRFVETADPMQPQKRAPLQHTWFRLAGRIADTPALHRAMLAYASDFNLITTALLPHGLSMIGNYGSLRMASLDHGMWFHRPFRTDEWLLYSCDSPSAQGARALARGQVFSLDGTLVASTIQEGMIRVVDAGAAP
jgi:acyl-CoA thioesterase-2